jgi:hypothetical protein
MQTKSSRVQGPARSIKPDDDYHGRKARPKLFRTKEPPSPSATYFWKATLPTIEKHRVSGFAKGTTKANTKTKSERHTTLLLVAMMYCLRRYISYPSPAPPSSSTNSVQLHPTPAPPSSTLPFTNPSNHLPPFDLLP